MSSHCRKRDRVLLYVAFCTLSKRIGTWCTSRNLWAGFQKFPVGTKPEWVVFSTVQSCINSSGSIHLQFFMMNSKLISTDFSGLRFKFDVVNELKCTEPHRGMAGQKDCGWHKMSGYILLTLQWFQAADEVSALEATAGTPCYNAWKIQFHSDVMKVQAWKSNFKLFCSIRHYVLQFLSLLEAVHRRPVRRSTYPCAYVFPIRRPSGVLSTF